MTFQQQVAILLTLTVVSDSRSESFVILSLNWLVLGLWAVVTMPSRTAARIELAIAKADRLFAVFPFGGQRTMWAIG